MSTGKRDADRLFGETSKLVDVAQKAAETAGISWLMDGVREAGSNRRRREQLACNLEHAARNLREAAAVLEAAGTALRQRALRSDDTSENNS